MSCAASSLNPWTSFPDLTGCLRPALTVLRPPPALTVSQWADQSRMLSSEASLEAGQWITSRAEYQRGIMDAVSDPSVRQVVAMTSAQVGKSEILLNIVGYFIDQDPSPILMVQPTVEMAEAFSKDRVAPMLRDTPALRGKVADPRSRDSGNTTTHKRFAGGHLTLVGSNAPSALASRPCRVILADEVSRFPASAGSEGDPVSLAIKRSATFWNRVVALTSTPTFVGDRIHTAYLQSDQRKFRVPCRHCGHGQELAWERVVYPADRPREAAYACEGCGAVWSEGDRLHAIQRGRWHATAAFSGVAGFHLSELYSPWRTIGDIAVDYEAAKGSPEMHRVWRNTSLGLPFEEVGEQADPSGLAARAEDYAAEVPEGVRVLTAGIDVQGDRLELEVVGWGEGEESWSIAYDVLPGLPAQPEVWEDLRDWLERPYLDATGQRWTVQAAGIDTGYLVRRVYEFCAAVRGRYVWPLKGRAGAYPVVESGTHRAKRIAAQAAKGRFRPHLVGVDEAKLILYRRIARVTQPGPGYVHVPKGRPQEWFDQLAAEQLVTRSNGYREWQKIRPRNEALDCRVYAYAALKLLHPGGVPVRKPKAEAAEDPKRQPSRLLRQREGYNPRRW
jgi:phage terminase large subunit GpA-like protein